MDLPSSIIYTYIDLRHLLLASIIDSFCSSSRTRLDALELVSALKQRVASLQEPCVSL
jgi:hypothetical protein